MNSGGMKFSLREGLMAFGALSCFAAVLCIGQLSADESDRPVRFKLSDDGEAGKVIVLEKAPEKRDAQRVFDNGLRFKRDENGNIYRIGDFKEVEQQPVASENPARETVKPTVDPELAEMPKSTKPKESTKALLPELPSLDTLFPKLEWSGFDEVFDGFVADSNSTVKRRAGTPGLKIKTHPQPQVDSVKKGTVEAPIQTEVAEPMPEVVASAPEALVSEQLPKKVVEETPVEVASDEPVTEKRVAPKNEKTIQEEEVVGVGANPVDVQMAVEKERDVDSVTGLPLLADLELSDLRLPEFELPNLSLFFGTSSKPLVNESGEIPEAIRQQAQVEEPLEESVEDMMPMESLVENVLETEASDLAATDAVVEAKPKSSPASSTSLFELPSIDLGLAEFFGLSTGTGASTESKHGPEQVEQSEGALGTEREDSSLDVDTHADPSVRHRAPGRKGIGGAGHRANKVPSNSGISYDLFSEFKIPEFNNPFSTGVDESKDIPNEHNPVQVPSLKRPTAHVPDSSILDALPELNSERPTVPGLKLMRTKAPKNVPIVEDVESTNSELEATDCPELGSGIPAAPVEVAEKEKLVDPDKILKDYKTEEK